VAGVAQRLAGPAARMGDRRGQASQLVPSAHTYSTTGPMLSGRMAYTTRAPRAAIAARMLSIDG
jgi:hypothetical protein